MASPSIVPAQPNPEEVSLQAALAELDELLDDVPAWEPAVGEEVIGLIVEYATYRSRFDNSEYVVATVRLPSGDFVRVFITPIVLRRLFAEWRPRLGETVRIRRLAGSKESKAKRFRLRVLGRQPTEASVPDFGLPVDSEAEDVTASEVEENAPPPPNDEDHVPF